MKEKKLFGYGTATSFLVVFLLMSSMVLVPVLGKEAVETTTDVDKKPLLTVMNIDPLSKGLWGCFNDLSFRAKFDEIKVKIEQKIHEYASSNPSVDEKTLKEFLCMLETFDYNSVKQRLTGINIDTYMYDMQNLLQVVDNLEDFKSEQTGSIGLLVKSQAIMDVLFDSTYGKNEYDQSPDSKSVGLRPLIGLSAGIISLIYSVVALVLYTLLGSVGLLFATAITIIFFAPIICYLIMFEASLDAIEYEPLLRTQLKEIFETGGPIGLLVLGGPLILAVDWLEGYTNQAMEEVFSKILLSDISFDPVTGAKNIHYSEYRPTITMGIAHDGDKITQNKQARFYVFAQDSDKYKDDEHTADREYRDYIQAGWDWNGDGLVDEWTDLANAYDDQGHPADDMTIYGTHTFSSAGEITVGCWLRDQWGVYSEWKTDTFNVEKKSLAFKPFLFNHFPVLSKLLNRLILMRQLVNKI